MSCGKLTSTKIYNRSGEAFHEMELQDGLVTSSRNYYHNSKRVHIQYNIDPITKILDGQEYSETGNLIYSGNFESGRRNGFGVQYNLEGINIYEGIPIHISNQKKECGRTTPGMAKA
jgi:antitoxin component YwqK of YwqJK toxin-antitoxin module